MPPVKRSNFHAHNMSFPNTQSPSDGVDTVDSLAKPEPAFLLTKQLKRLGPEM